MKMNEETMALYRREGVNPVGGCLPMLLQMPFLFAIYGVLTWPSSCGTRRSAVDPGPVAARIRCTSRRC